MSVTRESSGPLELLEITRNHWRLGLGVKHTTAFLYSTSVPSSFSKDERQTALRCGYPPSNPWQRCGRPHSVRCTRPFVQGTRGRALDPPHTHARIWFTSSPFTAWPPYAHHSLTTSFTCACACSGHASTGCGARRPPDAAGQAVPAVRAYSPIPTSRDLAKHLVHLYQFTFCPVWDSLTLRASRPVGGYRLT